MTRIAIPTSLPRLTSPGIRPCITEMDKAKRLTRMTRNPFPTKMDGAYRIPARIAPIGRLILLE